MKNYYANGKPLEPYKPKKVEQKSTVPKRYYRVPAGKNPEVAVENLTVKIEKEKP